jgi:hypothetical protein
MRYILLFFLWIGLTGLARGQNLNFATTNPLYPDGATSHSYSNIGNPAVDVTINISSSGSQTFGLGTPKRAGTGLVLNVNFASSSDSKQIVITFSKGVSNLSFSILGIEYVAGKTQDKVTINADRYNVPGFNPPSAPANAPSLSPSPYATVSGNTFTGNADDPGSAASSVSFSGFVQKVYINYSSGPSAPSNPPQAQGITIGPISWAAPLPVELLYFRAQPQGNAVALSWATTWERNAGKFTIQRSRNLTEFVAVGEVSATGNSDSRQTYAFTDNWPDAGINYYRLLQTDRDGTTQQARPVAVTLDDETPALAVLENPTTAENITVATRNLADATFRLVSLTGQPILLSPENQENSTTVLRANGAISAGLYWLQAIRSDGQTVGARVLVISH